MNTFDDLLKNREKISKAVQDATEGEIIDFDFMIDHLTMGGRPSIVTIMLSVPAKVKRNYDFDMDQLLDKHTETIRQIISVFGFPELFSRSIRYMVL